MTGLYQHTHVDFFHSMFLETGLFYQIYTKAVRFGRMWNCSACAYLLEAVHILSSQTRFTSESVSGYAEVESSKQKLQKRRRGKCLLNIRKVSRCGSEDQEADTIKSYDICLNRMSDEGVLYRSLSFTKSDMEVLKQFCR